MEKVMIKLKKLIVDQTDTKNNRFHMTIYYEESGRTGQIKKVYNFEESSDFFAEKAINEIKQQTRQRICGDDDDDDPLCNYALVMMEEKEEGQQQEKLASAVKRLKEKVKNFKSLKMSTDYINKYQELSTLQAEL
ncbi:MAG: hypothetical protein V1645_05215 [archaeon]